MFTGIIQEVGSIQDVSSLGEGLLLTIEAPKSSSHLSLGDSVAVNGVCLTVVKQGGARFAVEAVEETLAKTTLARIMSGTNVNLEPAMQLADRLGGHLVQGHVDAIGTVRSLIQRVNSWIIEIKIPPEYLRYVIPAGSIAVDGISLTIASVKDDSIFISIIPHTMENTNASSFKVGIQVNLEFDLIGKYVERLLASGSQEGGVTREKLKQWGYEG